MDPRQDDVEIGEMKSKPTFTVDIIRGNQTLGFTCSFNNQPGASGADDNYSMSAITFLKSNTEYLFFWLFYFLVYEYIYIQHICDYNS